jgi:hypothetical protein
MGSEYFSIADRSCLFKTSSINDSIRDLFFDIDKTVIFTREIRFVGNDPVGLFSYYSSSPSSSSSSSPSSPSPPSSPSSSISGTS